MKLFLRHTLNPCATKFPTLPSLLEYSRGELGTNIGRNRVQRRTEDRNMRVRVALVVLRGKRPLFGLNFHTEV